MSAVLQYMKAMALGMLAGLPVAVGVRLLCALRRRRSGARTTPLHEGLALLLLGGLLAALLCGKVGKRSNKRLVKSHKKLRSI